MGVILRATDNFGNKQDLDILDEGGLFCDISAIESSDIGQVYGVSSKEFMLPGTDKNNQFFGNMFDLGADPSVALNHTIYCTVLIDGQEGFEGRLYVNNILKDDKGYVMYKAIVINETVDFKSRIKDLALSDLNFDEYDHRLTLAAVTSSWEGDLFGGDIVYPLIDFGTSVPDTTIAQGTATETGSFTHEASPLSILDLKPTVRLKTVIDKVFDQVDYTYSSSFFDSDYFNRIYVVATPDEARGIPGGAPTDDNFLANRVGDTDQIVADNATGVIDFTNEVYDNGDNFDADTIYTVPFDGNFDIDSTLRVTYGVLPAAGRFRRLQINIQVNGVVKATEVKYSQGRFLNIAISKTLLNLSGGDQVRITLKNETRLISQPTFAVPGDSCRVKNTQESSFSIRPSLKFNEQVQPNQIFAPDLKVRDFLQGLIEKFNLVLEPKQDERKVIKIEPFNTWRDSGVEKDWSHKVDHSVRKSIKGTMIDQAHIINLSDEEDDDYLNAFNQDNYGKVFGSALYTSDSDMTEGTLEIGSFFAATPVAAVDGTSDVIIPHIYEEENGTKKPLAFKPRLLHFTGLRTGSDLNAYDTNGDLDGIGYYLEDFDNNVEKFEVYAQFHHLDLDQATEAILPTFAETRDLNFNNTQQFHYVPLALQSQYYVERDAIYEYWSQYLNELYHPESKMVTMNLMFTPDEIKDIALNDKIFIDGHYYRINNISNFDLLNESSTQVTLIKAPVRKFNYPVRRIYNIDGAQTGVTASNGNDTGGQFQDVTIERIGEGGTVTYVFADDLNAATGSGNQRVVRRASAIDGYRYIANDSGSAIWNSVPTQPTIEFRRQRSQGNNTVLYSADNIDISGFNNEVGSNSNVVSIIGSANKAQDNTEFVTIQGSGNTAESFVKKSAIFGSTNSTITNNTELAVIIGGEDTTNSGSNKSVIIGQDLTVQGGNSNVVIGNVDTETKTVKDLVNTTVINLNKDIESIENADGDHYSGIAHLGTYNQVGAMYRDYAVVTGSAGGETYLTGSDFANAYYIHLTWQGVNGTHTFYLPPTQRDPLSRDGNGYKRELRFFSDNTLVNNSTIFRLQPSGSDIIDGTTFSEDLKRPLDGATIFGTPGQWFTLQRKSK